MTLFLGPNKALRCLEVSVSASKGIKALSLCGYWGYGPSQELGGASPLSRQAGWAIQKAKWPGATACCT